MSTHEDWQEAKDRRDSAAYHLSKAYLAGAQAIVDEQAPKFAVAEADMQRIEKELNGTEASA